jgi:uncharacterized protein (DUF1810 family)
MGKFKPLDGLLIATLLSIATDQSQLLREILEPIWIGVKHCLKTENSDQSTDRDALSDKLDGIVQCMVAIANKLYLEFALGFDRRQIINSHHSWFLNPQLDTQVNSPERCYNYFSNSRSP